MSEVQTVVAGAGVIGLAIARRLARAGHEVLILEAETAHGQHTSSHNSQVIHAGIYYEPGSHQQRLCVSGKMMLYDYCATRHVDHARCGKLVVATREDQLAGLKELRARGRRNGVDDLELLDGDAARALEPEVASLGALLSPSTGIVDAPGLMLSLLGEAESAGAMLALDSPLVAASRESGGFRLRVGDAAQTRLSCRNLVNAAGHGAWDVARGIEGLDPALIPRRFMARGSYFALPAGARPFSRLIYPMPDAGSLGLHVVLDLDGRVKFGPDVEWLAPGAPDYRVDPARAPAFEEAVRAYWPGLPEGALLPEGCGLRPRIWGPGEEKADFLFQGADAHGIDGLVNLFGMESPGLTSCLAIARHVEGMLEAG